tara:strand:+ start:12079 stop:12639 length:561 start_codon:yes stop_codon:yes gene_type:complete
MTTDIAPSCPVCALANRREVEIKLHRGEITGAFLENKFRWNIGTVGKHMDEHLSYDPLEANRIEQLRDESISTLNVAENLVQRLVTWMDELEVRKDEEGLTSELIGDATKLFSQAQGFLKLIGQLKKEIGIDSQMMMADQKVNSMLGILVDVLKHEPMYLDQIQLRLASLQAPIVTIHDADFEVVD